MNPAKIFTCQYSGVGSNVEANNGTAAVAVQRRGRYASTTILLGKHIPAATGCCLCGSRRGVTKRDGAIVELTVNKSSAGVAVTTEPEHVKLKNIHC
jgi:hypothetical protein